MNDIALQGDASEAVNVPLPPVRMNRSMPFSSVHGERGPSDPWAGVGFIQDGLPFDPQGYCITDHPSILAETPAGAKLRAVLERKLKKAIANQAKEKPRRAASAESDGVESGVEAAAVDDDDDEEDLEPIDLVAWLRGEQRIEWPEMTQELARRYKRRFTKVEDAVEFLVKEEQLVQKGALQKKFQKFV